MTNTQTNKQIHWLSIINSFVLVLLLTAFLAVILMRVLKNDFSRYMEMDEDDIVEEEGGWKLIHGDVFRFPQVSQAGRPAFIFIRMSVCMYICGHGYMWPLLYPRPDQPPTAPHNK